MPESEAKQYVIFRLGKEEFGFDVANVREIQSIDNITTVHGSAKYIEGVMNLRGKLVTVINMRSRFGMAPASEAKEPKIVVIDAADAPVGFIVDEVTEVVHITDSTIEKVPSHIASNIESEYVLGIAKREERLITLIDPIKVLELSIEPNIEPRRSQNV
jgi:purine-binding chemotaxis protein CheW